MPSINNAVYLFLIFRILGFNLGICIPFFEIDEKFVRVYQLHSNKDYISAGGMEARELPLKSIERLAHNTLD